MSKIEYRQQGRGDSPWPVKERIRILLWDYSWALLCRHTPKPLNWWRLRVLKFFGANILGEPFVHQRARISHPWRLKIEHGATVGDRASLYTLGEIHISKNATIAQESYLCTGTHAFDSVKMELITNPIKIGEGAFVGLRATVLSGVEVGNNAIIGSCALVNKNVAPWTVVAGNPARCIRVRDQKKGGVSERFIPPT